MYKKNLIVPIIFVCMLTLSLVFTSPARAANSYYVSPSGNDSNPGTQAQPWLTIQKCLNSVKAGDTCLIGAGTYNESLSLKTSGASGAPITLQNNNGGTVTVNSGNSKTLQTTGRQSYYTINGYG